MSFGRSRSWNIKLFFFFFFLPRMVATTTNLFINGCSLHGSHQIIIFEAKNSDKSRDGFVTGLSCFEWKNGISDGWVCEEGRNKYFVGTRYDKAWALGPSIMGNDAVVYKGKYSTWCPSRPQNQPFTSGWWQIQRPIGADHFSDQTVERFTSFGPNCITCL